MSENEERKTLRLSSDFARFIENTCEENGLKQSEFMDQVYEGYKSYMNREKNNEDIVTDTAASKSDGEYLRILSGLNKIYDAVSTSKDQENPEEKDRSVNFELIEKQIKSLSECTKKYSTLHSIISSSSKGIEDGLKGAEDRLKSIEKRADRYNQMMDKSWTINRESVSATVKANEKFNESVSRLQDELNGYTESELKRNVRALGAEFSSICQDTVRSSRMYNKVAGGFLAVCVVATSVSSFFVWQNANYKTKYDHAYSSYQSLADKVCALPSNPSVAEVQKIYCRKI